MKNQFMRALACLLALVMLLSAVPVSSFAAFSGTASTAAAASKTHKHKKVTTIKKATASNNGLITVKCSSCKKTLSKKTISKIKTVTLKKSEYSYTGKAIKPSVTVKDSKGKTLKNGKDFTVTYSANKNPGKATAKVTFKGNYSGTKQLSFTIMPTLNADLVNDAGKSTFSMNLSWNKVTGAFSYKVSLYQGKKLVKTITTTRNETSAFKKLKQNTKYRIDFTALNLFGKKILSDSGDFKTPKAKAPISIPSTPREIVSLYNKAVNTLKKEKKVKIKEENSMNLKCTDCSVAAMTSSVNTILKSFSGSASETVAFRNGKGTTSHGEKTTVNDFVSPSGRQAALRAESTVSSSAVLTSSDEIQLTIVLKKETAEYNEDVIYIPLSGNFNVTDTLNFSAIELPLSSKITKAKVVYTGTKLQATINKSGKLKSLKIYMPFKTTVSGKVNDISMEVSL